jgi:hypothetical protein
MFPAYVENPLHTSFVGQDPDEEILLLLRAHPITNLKWIIPAILVFFIPFLIPPFFSLLNFNFEPLPTTYAMALIIINYLLVLVIIFEGFLGWYFNVYMVTTKNIVDIDFENLLSSNIDLTPISNVEDANSAQNGILASIFNYGNVFVRSAGAKSLTDFIDVPRPHAVADFVIDQAHQAEANP